MLQDYYGKDDARSYDIDTLSLMSGYAKQESIEFFKWYLLKVTSLCHYLTEIKPLVTSEELEAKIEEFEGKPINDLYELYIQSKKQ